MTGGVRKRWFNKKTPCAHGHTHDSAKEARHCELLHQRQLAGEITNLRIQPVYNFTLNGQPIKHDNGHLVRYTPDFDYFEGHSHVVDEVKGAMVNESWPLRRAIFRAFYPYIELRVVKV